MNNIILKAALISMLLFINKVSFCQLVVTPQTTQNLVQNVLLGPGVILNSVNAGTAANQIGQFTNGNTTNLGLSSGVVMCSGRIQDIANLASASASFSTTSDYSDGNLSSLIPGFSTHDAASIIFTFTPLSDTVSFRYVFASEEYPEFVCSDYNDVFGFFISGANPAGGNYVNKNLAIVPGTATTPVAINSINSGSPGSGYAASDCISTSYSSMYVNNSTGTKIVYDGFTKPLKAICRVVPCTQYTIKLAVSDVSDQILDSGVFIEAGSFSANNEFTTSAGSSDTTISQNCIENCTNGLFKFFLPAPLATAYTINFTVLGTATPGVDYTLTGNTGNSVVIPAGQTSATITVNTVPDAIVEGTESVKLRVFVPPCTYDTLTLNIADNPPFYLTTMNDTSVCDNDNLLLHVQGNGGVVIQNGQNYNYQWSANANSALTPSTIVYPSGIGTTHNYVVTVKDRCNQQIKDTVKVLVKNCTPCGANAGPGGKVCSLTYNLQATTQAGDVSYWTSLPAGAVFSNASSPTSSVTVPVAGTYKFIWHVTNITGLICTDTMSVIFATTPTSAFSVSNISCFGNNTQVTYQGTGTASAIYTWAFPNGTPATASTQGPHQVSFNTAGTQTISLTVEENGCTSPATSHTVVNPPLLTSSVSVIAATCPNSPSLVTPSASGGTGSYTYMWGDGINPPTATAPTTQGSYYMTVTDNNGCTSSNFFTISTLQAIVVTESHQNLRCNGVNDGQIFINASGGSGNFTYQWSPGGMSTALVTGLSATTYQVTVTDANGCFVIKNIPITQPPPLTGSVNNITDVSCFGGSNGSFVVTASGGTPEISYSINGGAAQASGTFTGLTPMQYNITIQDANNCVLNKTATINEPTQVVINSTTSTNIPCNGQHNGTITVTASGGTPNLTYAISNPGQNSGNFTGLYPGNYVVTVTDSKGCQAVSNQVTISQPTALVINSVQTTNLTCYNSNNGTVNISVSGGSLPYTFTGNNSVSNNTGSFSNAPAGTFTVTITDANNCTIQTNPFTITQPPQLIITNQTATSLPCFGNTAALTVVATGGTAPLGYSLNGAAPTNSGFYTGLPGGSYTVVITDNKGCSVTSNTFNITEPPQLLIVDSGYTNVTCNNIHDGTMWVSATGGVGPYTYSYQPGISQNDSMFVNLNPGTYNLIVKDYNNCRDTARFTITQPLAISATSTTTPPRCYGGNDGIFNISATGGTPPYTYASGSTTNANGIFQNLIAGNYFVTITDYNNCTFQSNPIMVSQPSQLVILSQNATPIACFGNTATITVTASGGTTPLSYSLNGGAPAATGTYSGLIAGNYIVRVTDANGCFENSNNISIVEPLPLVVSDSGFVNSTCYNSDNGQIWVSVNGGTTPYGYSITNGTSQTSPVFTNLSPGYYTITISDINGCSDTRSFTVSEPTQLIANATSTNVKCYGQTNGTASVTANGGTPPYSYLWSHNGETGSTINNLSNGVFFVSVTDLNNCSDSKSVTISQPEPIQISSSPDATICKGEDTLIIVTTTGGTTPYTFFWNGIQGFPTNSYTAYKDSTFNISVTDVNGCTSNYAQTTIHIYPPVILDVFTDNDSICKGSNTIIQGTISGGIGNMYELFNQEGIRIQFPYVVTPYFTQSFAFSAGDECGISGFDTIRIYTIDLPDVHLLTDVNKGCQPLTVKFSPQTTIECTDFLWNFGDEQAYSSSKNPVHVYNQSGTFDVSVTVTSKDGCSNSGFFPQWITVYPKPESRFDYEPDIASILKPEIYFTNHSVDYSTVQGLSNFWAFGDGDSSVAKNPVHMYPNPGVYKPSLVVSTVYGCKDTSVATIHIKDEVSLYAPTAFSPDQNGINDIFLVEGHGINLTTFKMLIYDRWGEVIFESSDIYKGWDGKVKGEEKGTCDTYVWIVTFNDLFGKKYVKSGNVTMIR